MKTNVFFKIQSLIFQLFFYKRVLRKLKNIKDYQNLQWIDKYLKFLHRSLDPNDRTLTLIIKNKSKTLSQKAILFNSLKINSSDSKIDISLSESPYKSLKLDLLSSTFIVMSLKYNAKNKQQLINDFRICRNSTTGMIEKSSLIYNGKMGRKMDHNIATFPMMNFPRTAFVLNKNTFWEIILNPGEIVTLTLLLLAKINFNNVLI